MKHQQDMEYESIAAQLSGCITYLAEKAKLPAGAVVVLGCSTSEVAGGRIGKNSVPELGKALAKAMLDTCQALGLRPVIQCCEHLNRALVMNHDTLKDLRLLQVNARPVPKAGGSVGAAAYDLLDHPVLAASIQADAALDVGSTLVGMHIRPVAVPLRMEDAEGHVVNAKVGQAGVVMAFARLPYIGGERACYPEG